MPWIGAVQGRGLWNETAQLRVRIPSVASAAAPLPTAPAPVDHSSSAAELFAEERMSTSAAVRARPGVLILLPLFLVTTVPHTHASPPPAPPSFGRAPSLTIPGQQPAHEPHVNNVVETYSPGQSENGSLVSRPLCRVSEAGNTPDWWLSASVTLWKFLPQIGVGLGVVCCVGLTCRWLRRRRSRRRRKSYWGRDSTSSDDYYHERHRRHSWGGPRRRLSWPPPRRGYSERRRPSDRMAESEYSEGGRDTDLSCVGSEFSVELQAEKQRRAAGHDCECNANGSASALRRGEQLAHVNGATHGARSLSNLCA